jgi:hypothetical protein
VRALFRGVVSGEYVYWRQGAPVPVGASDIISISYRDNYLGAYTTGNLPTGGDILVGDTAFDLTLGQLVVCIAVGPVVWSAIGPISPAPQRPPIDANHTNVWYLGAGSTTTGLDILPDVGSVTLNRSTGTGVYNLGYNLFTTQPSGYATEPTLNGDTTFEAPLSPTIGPTQDFTVEAIMSFPSQTVDTLPASLGAVIVARLSPLEYAQIAYRSNVSTAPSFLTLSNGAFFAREGVYGAAPGNVTPGLRTHLMVSWAAGVALNYYINGRALAATTGSAAQARLTAMDNIFVKFASGASMADVRISNIVRPQSYAIAATQAMLAL